MRESIYLFFDDQCVLCNRTVGFLLRKDKTKVFIFVSLRSNFAQKALKERVSEVKDSKSFLLLKDGKMYSESSAALVVGKALPGIWKMSQIFWLVPKFIRNAVYRLVAKNRYKWFGRQDSCQLLTPENKERFILE